MTLKSYFRHKKSIVSQNIFKNDKIDFNLNLDEKNSNFLFKKLNKHLYSFLKYKYYYNRFRKFLKKTKNGNVINIKRRSVRMDKNMKFLEKFFNVSMNRGKKNTLLKHFNSAVCDFYLPFKIFDNNFLQNYSNFSSVSNLISSRKEYYNISYLLNDSIYDLYPIFNIAFKKNTKKNKNSKLKRKLNVIYIPVEKRLKHTLKLINFYSEKFKSYKYNERLMLTLLSIILDQRNSYLWKRKIYVYSKVLKDKQKRAI